MFPKAKTTEAQQAIRIQTWLWLAQDGKIANMRERLASVSEALVGRCTRSARSSDKRRAATSDRVQRRSCFGMNEAIVRCSRKPRCCRRWFMSTSIPSAWQLAENLEDSDYTSIQQRIRETALELGNGGDQLEAVVGVPGT